MPTVTIRYTLPDEQAEYDAARLGGEAMQVLWQIDQTCRSLLKHGQPTAEERRLAEQIREMIPGEMLEI
jgi:glutamate-1-semialdehyde aminotransferase